MVSSFKYLGRVLAALNDNWPVVSGKPIKAWAKWDRLSRIFGREGENTLVWMMFFKEVVQPVLLFRLETWATNPHTGRGLGGFHQRAA